jgi:hypothetical protein
MGHALFWIVSDWENERARCSRKSDTSGEAARPRVTFNVNSDNVDNDSVRCLDTH